MSPPAALLTEACVLAAAARVGLRAVSVPRLVRLLAHLPRARGPAHSVEACLAAAAHGAARAAHPTCLFRSLVAFALLVRRRHEAAIHLGASNGAGFGAHAWISVGGRLPAGERDDGAAPLWHYRAGPPAGG